MSMKILDFVQLDGASLIEEAVATFKDSATSSTKRVLELTTDATHSGKIINKRVYRGKHVKDGAKTFFKNEDGAKFNKPFLKNHNPELDAIGRVVDAVYHATLTGKRWEEDYLEPTEEGSGFLRTTSHIMDQDAIEKFLDGRYATVSQSATTDGAFCSTCTRAKGALVPIFSQWTDSDDNTHDCDHYPGDIINDSMNYLITGRMNYAELSQVNKPADDGGIHVGMKIIQDHLKDSESFFGIMKDRIKEIEIIKAPVRGRILDSEGKLVSSLNVDEYVPTKTISIPSQKVEDKKENKEEVNDHSVSTEDQEVSALELADARVLSHLSSYFNLNLSDDEKAKLEILSSDKLTDTQKEEMNTGLYLTDSLPFVLNTQETLDACVRYADRIFTSDKARETYMSALKKQADSENLIFNQKGHITMDEKQAKALLESLDSMKTKVEALETQVKDLETERDELKKNVTDSKVQEVITLRAQVGYADCADFESKSDEDKAVVLKRYNEMSDELLAHIHQEAKDNVAAGVVIGAKLGDSAVNNPLETSDEEAEAGEAGATQTTTVSDSEEAPSITSKTSIL